MFRPEHPFPFGNYQAGTNKNYKEKKSRKDEGKILMKKWTAVLQGPNVEKRGRKKS